MPGTHGYNLMQVLTHLGGHHQISQIQPEVPSVIAVVQAKAQEGHMFEGSYRVTITLRIVCEQPAWKVRLTVSTFETGHGEDSKTYGERMNSLMCNK